MQSKVSTVQLYLAELPEERRAAIEAVRAVILENLDEGYEEGMQYGMIGYFVPHRVFPAGYHCDPKQPLPFAGLASQKNYMSLYLMGLYCGGDDGGETEDLRWFREAWARTGKKLDMGKACIRFKKLENLPLDVIGEAIKRFPAKKYIALHEQGLQARSAGSAQRKGKAADKGEAARAAKTAATSRAARGTTTKTRRAT